MLITLGNKYCLSICSSTIYFILSLLQLFSDVIAYYVIILVIDNTIPL